MSNKKEKKNIIAHSVRIDPNIGLIEGPIIGKELKDQFLIFKSEIEPFFTNTVLISHVGYKDFSLIFGNINVYYEKSVPALFVAVFPLYLINNFLTSLESVFKRNINEKIDSDEFDSLNADSAKQMSIIYTEDTIYFPINSYFIEHSHLGDFKIYFGRYHGKINKKDTSFFSHSIVTTFKVIASLISAIKENIEKFTKITGIDLSELTKTAKIGTKFEENQDDRIK